MIKGQIVSLRPATSDDKRQIYEWLVQWRHLFSDDVLPQWEEFCYDYKPFFFDGSKPKTGRCFVIMVRDKPVGHISYHKLCKKFQHTELDIWMESLDNCGKGYGVDALKTLCDYLFKNLGVREFVIRPLAENYRAVRAYEKAGFCKVDCSLAEQVLKYGAPDSDDCIVMIKRIEGAG